jgi:hypothetical protein
VASSTAAAVEITVLLTALPGAGCRAEPAGSPAETSAAVPAAPSASSPAAASVAMSVSAAEPLTAAAPSASARPAPVGGDWLRCYASFQPRTQPRLDVARLGLSCGPVNGMKKLADPVEAEVAGDAGPGRQHTFVAQAGDCYRIFAVAGPGVEDLDVEVFAPDGRRVARDTGDDRWPIVNPDGPFCVFDPGEHRAVVTAPRTGGSYAVQIWRLR